MRRVNTDATQTPPRTVTKMTKRTRKLGLKKETLKSLNSSTLGQVQGGLTLGGGMGSVFSCGCSAFNVKSAGDVSETSLRY